MAAAEAAAVRRAAIADKAESLGFDRVGIAAATAAGGQMGALESFIANGYHGDMGWLALRARQRASPTGLWPAAKSVVVLAASYAPDGDPLALLDRTDRGNISVYARGRDYHDVLKPRLRVLAAWIAERYSAEVKLFVDTAPVMEKPLAARAGIGWQGKHTNLVSRDFGSWLFLGEIYTTLDLAADAPHPDLCGSCRRCQEVCPTNAFPAPYRLDATRCISYLTIEHKGHIAPEFRAAIGNRIYGCDDCLAVCPWNKFAQAAHEAAFAPRAALEAPYLAELAALDDAAFRKLFAGSAIKRLGRDRFVRNVLIAIGNSGAPALAAAAEPLLADASALVRAMAVWALGRLVDRKDFSALRQRHETAEPDAAVRAEWSAPEHD